MHTLPFPLRFRVAYHPGLLNAVLRLFIRAVESWYRRRAKEAGVVEPRWGAVTVLQRFGSAAQLTPHAHTLGMDGVFAACAGGRAVRFHPIRPPTDNDIIREIVEDLAARVAASLPRSGLFPSDDERNGTVSSSLSFREK